MTLIHLAGMFSFFAPQFITYIRFRSAFRQLAHGIPGPYTNPKLNKSLSYSLGISGALHACVTLWVLCDHPDTPAFLGFGSDSKISRRMVWTGVCALEFVCMLASVGNIGWAGNLCGVLFGALYDRYGYALWVYLRACILAEQFPDTSGILGMRKGY
jgi:hypothetical protein